RSTRREPRRSGSPTGARRRWPISSVAWASAPGHWPCSDARTRRSRIEAHACKRRRRLMRKDIRILEAQKVEIGPGGEEFEAGLRQIPALLTHEHGIEPCLDRVEIEDIGGSILKLLLGQLCSTPVRALLLLRKLNADELADEILEAVTVRIGAGELGGDFRAVKG